MTFVKFPEEIWLFITFRNQLRNEYLDETDMHESQV